MISQVDCETVLLDIRHPRIYGRAADSGARRVGTIWWAGLPCGLCGINVCGRERVDRLESTTVPKITISHLPIGAESRTHTPRRGVRGSVEHGACREVWRIRCWAPGWRDGLSGIGRTIGGPYVGVAKTYIQGTERRCESKLRLVGSCSVRSGFDSSLWYLRMYNIVGGDKKHEASSQG
eukprot:1285462-Amorphochlora_amoeboformis.AAC.2